MKSSTAFAPATVANVSCGFDILGFAVHGLGDTVTATFCNEKGVHLVSIEGDNGILPYEAEKNVCTVAVRYMLDALDRKEHIALSLKKGLPLGSGLGSSAASTVAALVSVNTLLDVPFSKKELLPFALEGERVACGAAHADNVAPSLLGGFVLIRDYASLDIISLPVPENLFVTLIHPHFELNTSDSRSVLRKNITLEESRIQSGNVAGFITGLFTNDNALIKRSLKDVIAEPSRAMLIPGFYEVRERALSAGALGSGISGSGPSIFILSPEKNIADRVEGECKVLYQGIGLDVDIYTSPVNTNGAEAVLEVS
jgi:homoserine kinase